MLVTFAAKLKTYLSGTHIRTVRLEDVSKIARLWVNHEDAAEIEAVLVEIEAAVDLDSSTMQRPAEHVAPTEPAVAE